MKPSRESLEKILYSNDGKVIYNKIFVGDFETEIPGLKKLAGCDQGTKTHFEGDAAVHTALVYEKVLENARIELGREADFIERLAALIHDWKKPETRRPFPDGSVKFPEHEALAAHEVSSLARRIDLTLEEEKKLRFLVAEHGHANHLEDLPPHKQRQLQNSPYILSLAVLQKSDAQSILLRDGTHRPIYWDLLLSKKMRGRIESHRRQKTSFNAYSNQRQTRQKSRQ